MGEFPLSFRSDDLSRPWREEADWQIWSVFLVTVFKAASAVFLSVNWPSRMAAGER